ncbi:MAG: PIN domain-containing protein [Candidatus Cloacimonetes bacterium]|nr:PIN domain-containing protein [Candidatus Cloacimonadota bacterium]
MNVAKLKIVSGNEIYLRYKYIIGLFNNDQNIVKMMAEIQELKTTVITIGELFYGAALSKDRDKNEKIIENFTKNSTIYEINLQVVKEYAFIKSRLRKQGTPIPENDIWIAAIAKANNEIVITRDKHLLDIDFIETELW